MDGGLCALEVLGKGGIGLRGAACICCASLGRTGEGARPYIPEEFGEFEAVFGCCGAYFEAHLA